MKTLKFLSGIAMSVAIAERATKKALLLSIVIPVLPNALLLVNTDLSIQTPPAFSVEILPPGKKKFFQVSIVDGSDARLIWSLEAETAITEIGM